MGRAAWGIFFLSVPIGLVVGRVSKRFERLNLPLRGVYAFVSLYAAVALMGLMMGVVASVYTAVHGFDTNATWICGYRPGLVKIIICQERLLLWAFSFSGYFLFLWPLAFANHVLIWRWTTPQNPSRIQSLGLTAIRPDGAGSREQPSTPARAK